MMRIKIFLFVSLSLLLAALFGGCFQTARPVRQKSPSLPSWFLNPPSSSGLYMYAAAAGKTKTDAVNNALSSLISTLSINIKSSYNSKIKEHNYYTDTKIRHIISAKTIPVAINNYTVLKAVEIGYANVAVLVQINKTKFANGLVSRLKRQKRDIDMKYDALGGMGALERYNALAKLMTYVRQMGRTLMIAEELSGYVTKRFDRLSYMEDIVRVRQRYISQKSALNFFITADAAAYGYKEALKNYISQQGFNVSDKKTKDSVSVAISLSCTVYDNKYMNIAVVHVLIKGYENSLHVGGRLYTFKERYFGLKSKAYQTALQDFIQAISKRRISAALGIVI